MPESIVQGPSLLDEIPITPSVPAQPAAKDRVRAPLRAPFTRYEKSAGSGEVEETARGIGLKGVIGELVSCPYCMSVWVASGLLLLFIINRRVARLVCKLLTMVTASHFLHRFYMRMEP
jgi:Protein of unknown function (DUF1360)